MLESKVSVTGSYTAVLKVPAAKSVRSFPDPAMSRTLPVCISAAWIDRTGDGLDAVVQVPSQAAAASTTTATASGLSMRRIGVPPEVPDPYRGRGDGMEHSTPDCPTDWSASARRHGYIDHSHGGDRHVGLAMARVGSRHRHRPRRRGR